MATASNQPLAGLFATSMHRLLKVVHSKSLEQSKKHATQAISTLWHTFALLSVSNKDIVMSSKYNDLANEYMLTSIGEDNLAVLGEPGKEMLEKQVSKFLDRVTIGLMLSVKRVLQNSFSQLKIGNVTYHPITDHSMEESFVFQLIVGEEIAEICITPTVFRYMVPSFDTARTYSTRIDLVNINIILQEVHSIQNTDRIKGTDISLIEDHVVRELVNDVTSVAKRYHAADSLRDRMSEVVQNRLKEYMQK
jgi:hypothetical protein